MGRAIDTLVVHCSATPPSMDIGVADIDRWHRQRGWNGIGYHYVITRKGTVQIGRDIEVPGAHAEGHNARSVGICLVGGVAEADPRKAEANFTPEQYAALAVLLTRLRDTRPQAAIRGHRDLPNVHKDCPSFDVRAWAKRAHIDPL